MSEEAAALPPWFFVAFGVLWLMVLAFVWSLAVMAARADRERERESRVSVPRRPPWNSAVSPPARSGRGGQLERARQERAARDVLRCAGGRVDAAPVECPVRERES